MRAVDVLYGVSFLPIRKSPEYWLPTPTKLFRDVSPPLTVLSLLLLLLTVPDVAETSICVSSWYTGMNFAPSFRALRMPMYDWLEIAGCQPTFPTGESPEPA